MAAERLFPVALVVLGAGAGTRFGEPKAGAKLKDGRRFTDAICDTAREAQLDPMIVVVPSDFTPPAGATAVMNLRPQGEQIASVRLGISRLANISCVGAIIWPVDHPFVSLESVLAIVDAAQRTGAPIVRPEFKGEHGHPVFFHRDTWRDLLTVKNGGAREVVHSYGKRVETVVVRDRGVLRDVDTVEALEGQ